MIMHIGIIAKQDRFGFERDFLEKIIHVHLLQVALLKSHTRFENEELKEFLDKSLETSPIRGVVFNRDPEINQRIFLSKKKVKIPVQRLMNN